MKTTIEMPDELFRTAKSVAAIRGQTLKQLITRVIERELAANRVICSTELSTEDYLRRLDALAQANAAAWKTGKTAEEAIANCAKSLIVGVGERSLGRHHHSVPDRLGSASSAGPSLAPGHLMPIPDPRIP